MIGTSQRARTSRHFCADAVTDPAPDIRGDEIVVDQAPFARRFVQRLDGPGSHHWNERIEGSVELRELHRAERQPPSLAWRVDDDWTVSCLCDLDMDRRAPTDRDLLSPPPNRQPFVFEQIGSAIVGEALDIEIVDVDKSVRDAPSDMTVVGEMWKSGHARHSEPNDVEFIASNMHLRIHVWHLEHAMRIASPISRPRVSNSATSSVLEASAISDAAPDYALRASRRR